MAEEPKRNKKDYLLTLLSGVQDVADDLVSKGREAVKEGQFAGDTARSVASFVEALPDDSSLPAQLWDEQSARWNTVRERAQSTLNAMTNINSLTFATEGTTISTSGMMSAADLTAMSSNARASAKTARVRFHGLVGKSELVSKIARELARLKIAAPRAEAESPADLVSKADQAFQAPSSSDQAASAVLLPLREAINSAIAEMVRRRPTQGPARGDYGKVESILTQCGVPSVNPVDIDRLAKDAEDIKGILSASKQSKLERDALHGDFLRGLVFFHSLLRAVDETKLRP